MRSIRHVPHALKDEIFPNDVGVSQRMLPLKTKPFREQQTTSLPEMISSEVEVSKDDESLQSCKAAKPTNFHVQIASIGLTDENCSSSNRMSRKAPGLLGGSFCLSILPHPPI